MTSRETKIVELVKRKELGTAIPDETPLSAWDKAALADEEHDGEDAVAV